MTPCAKRVFLVLDHIPHTPSNKIDRKALAAAYASVDIAGWERGVERQPVVAGPYFDPGVAAPLGVRVGESHLQARRDAGRAGE